MSRRPPISPAFPSPPLSRSSLAGPAGPRPAARATRPLLARGTTGGYTGDPGPRLVRRTTGNSRPLRARRGREFPVVRRTNRGPGSPVYPPVVPRASRGRVARAAGRGPAGPAKLDRERGGDGKAGDIGGRRLI